ncbi:3'-5' exonuclease, partial [Neisseria zoodegmatis]
SRWPLLAGCFARLGIPVAIVDLESTGGNLYQDRVTEVAILRFENGQIARYEWLVNPQQPIPSFITGLTGIDDTMVANAPVFAELVSELLPLLRGALLVAHNSRFDYTFLRHEFQRAGVDFAAPTLCTVQF